MHKAHCAQLRAYIRTCVYTSVGSEVWPTYLCIQDMHSVCTVVKWCLLSLVVHAFLVKHTAPLAVLHIAELALS